MITVKEMSLAKRCLLEMRYAMKVLPIKLLSDLRNQSIHGVDQDYIDFWNNPLVKNNATYLFSHIMTRSSIVIKEMFGKPVFHHKGKRFFALEYKGLTFIVSNRIEVIVDDAYTPLLALEFEKLFYEEIFKYYHVTTSRLSSIQSLIDSLSTYGAVKNGQFNFYLI